MTAPLERPRRLRRTSAIRRLVAETTLEPRHLILPIFVKEGLASPEPISSLPGVFQHSLQSLEGLIDDAVGAGLGAVMVFGVPVNRDETGEHALDQTNILHRAVSVAAQRARGQLVIMADVCLDEFTSHGHCGVLDRDGNVDNDVTISLYGTMAVSLAAAGADVMGLSGMMDGQVQAVREALDQSGFSDRAILGYSAKFASSFYGPFRDAVESTLEGDRTTYQQDYRNRRDAYREVTLDLAEGADIVMVKPAWSYLDILRDTADISGVPVAAYVVSGEHAMLEIAAQQGVFERETAIRELLTAVRRAGADMICTYWALEAAQWIRQERW